MYAPAVTAPAATAETAAMVIALCAIWGFFLIVFSRDQDFFWGGEAWKKQKKSKNALFFAITVCSPVIC
jgi:hypothetical protein